MEALEEPTVAHMIGYMLKLDGKNCFVGGTSQNPFIQYAMLPNQDEVDYAVIEVSAAQLRGLQNFNPMMVVFTNISESFSSEHFKSVGEYIETKLSIIKSLSTNNHLVVNFDTLANNTFFRNAPCNTYWYSRKSFVKMV